MEIDNWDINLEEKRITSKLLCFDEKGSIQIISLWNFNQSFENELTSGKAITKAT